MAPTRLLESGEETFEVRLLRAHRSERPPDGALIRAEQALWLSAGTAAVSIGATGHGAATTMVRAAVLKWFGIGLASGLVAASGARFATDPALRAMLLDERVTTMHAHGATTARNAASHVEAPLEPVTAALRPATRVTNAPQSAAFSVDSASRKGRADEAAPRATGVDDPSSPTPSLSAELALLEGARRALVAHRPADVLAALDAYDASATSGVLDQEARLLRIEALLQSGQDVAAKSLAARALQEEPAGPHSGRLRDILAAAPK